MGRFVLIGGGECGRPGSVYETEKIDQEIVNLSGKSSPRFLLIALGNEQPEMYYDLLGTIYRERFNCRTDQLTEQDLKSESVIREKIDNADIIYVGGGNSLRLLKCFRKYGIDKMLEKAYKKNVVLCGLSAGAICWCKYGNSDSRNPYNENRELIRVRALGFLEILMCPHYDSQHRRSGSLKRMMERTYKIPAIALEDCVALKIVDDYCCIITAREGACAYKVYWKNKVYVQEKLEEGILLNLDALKIY